MRKCMNSLPEYCYQVVSVRFDCFSPPSFLPSFLLPPLLPPPPSFPPPRSFPPPPSSPPPTFSLQRRTHFTSKWNGCKQNW